MTGWNLPPGCNEWNIPGNGPIDILYERLADKFCANCLEEEICTEKNPDLCNFSKEFRKIIDIEIGFTY